MFLPQEENSPATSACFCSALTSTTRLSHAYSHTLLHNIINNHLIFKTKQPEHKQQRDDLQLYIIDCYYPRNHFKAWLPLKCFIHPLNTQTWLLVLLSCQSCPFSQGSSSVSSVVNCPRPLASSQLFIHLSIHLLQYSNSARLPIVSRLCNC